MFLQQPQQTSLDVELWKVASWEFLLVPQIDPSVPQPVFTITEKAPTSHRCPSLMIIASRTQFHDCENWLWNRWIDLRHWKLFPSTEPECSAGRRNVSAGVVTIPRNLRNCPNLLVCVRSSGCGWRLYWVWKIPSSCHVIMLTLDLVLYAQTLRKIQYLINKFGHLLMTFLARARTVK